MHPVLLPLLKRADAEVSTPTLLTLLAKFRENGASKLSLLGGEPTLYGRRTDNEPLPFIVRCARELGYSYIRLVSNGLFPHALLDEPDLKLLDEITFSIDGDTAEMHDHLRGKGTFIRTCRSVRAAVARGYDVQIRRACIVGTSVGSQADISC